MSLTGQLELCKSNAAYKHIESISFSVASGQYIEKAGLFEVVSKQLYDDKHVDPAAYGLLDPRLGISEKLKVCGTCHGKVHECPGHSGYIKLEFPVFHVGFFSHTLILLQIICKNCSRVLLPDERMRKKFLKSSRAKFDLISRERVFSKLRTECKKQSICRFCNYENAQVKKIGMKILHDKFSNKNSTNFECFKQSIEYLSRVRDLTKTAERPSEDLTPLRALRLFENMIQEDAEIVGMGISAPCNLIITHLQVPPVCIRPSVPISEGLSNEDDLTTLLQEILKLNGVMKMTIERGKELKKIMEEWESLQALVFQYMNSDAPGIPPSLALAKKTRSLFQRLKGKNGRFRWNLTGKRVDFSGRTVISPDPNVKISEVVVPLLMAKGLTFPERVTTHNIEHMRQLVKNGPHTHPGANLVTLIDGTKMSLYFAKRVELGDSLQIGDVVERHMLNGDYVLFNRQPSLHRISIMAHRALIMHGRTLRFNECVCAPYNADFDGDEMNIHFPQTYEAQADIQTLMSVTSNILAPKSGDSIIAPTQDFLTCSFLLTQKDVFYDRASFFRYITFFTDALGRIEVPLPAVIRPRELWTGKQLFSILISPNKHSPLTVNTALAEKNYTKNRELCARDGFVLVRNSELLAGNIGKTAMGGSKTGLVYLITKNYGGGYAEDFMSRVAKLSAR